MSQAHMKPALTPDTAPNPVVGILLPLPLAGPYDYKLPPGVNAVRGTLVAASLGSRQVLGVVWRAAEGSIEENRLKLATPLAQVPPLPAKLCDFIDWVATYTLNPPGAILALALRSRKALEPEVHRSAYVRGGNTPRLISKARARALNVSADGLARSISALAQEANISPAVIRALIAQGALERVELPEFEPFARPEARFLAAQLNDDQTRAAQRLRQSVGEKKFAVHLLDGVTGSGKTEVYFEAAAEALEQGKQVLILLPEIALTVQFLDRFAERFGVRPGEWHSDLSQKERRRTYRAVMNASLRVVAGARSALFLPFSELGLIIVDEEHDQAFKQQDGAVYHARDMAVVRARIEDCPIILASATPSLETFVNAQSSRYTHLKLPSRHGRAQLPEIRLVDMRRERDAADARMRSQWLSQSLRNQLERTLMSGEQAMLFLNRRGYAPLTLCAACGHKFVCPNCACWLVEHRYRKRLVCHLCGYELGIPSQCPSCAQQNLIACGPGIERVAEEFAAFFPKARFCIASSDTLHGPAQTQAAITAMTKREVDVLIGTQIIAKGHHFPHLTFVGVIDADLGGSDGDPRARERTYQLLHQVSGRAGRAEKPGLVMIQTRNPDDPVMQALARGIRDKFYEQEQLLRQSSGAPPFGRLAALVVSGYDAEAVKALAGLLAKCAPRAKDLKVWGPAAAFYALLRGQTRERLLVQAARSIDMQAYLKTWLRAIKIPANIKVSVDIDPVSFF